MSISSERVKLWRKRSKERMLEIMGGKCAICGYNKSHSALEFHHLDPTQKDFSFGRVRANPKSWNKITQELRKCIMLCANCHREVHDGSYEGILISSFIESDTDLNIENISTTFCKICGGPKSDRALTCSKKCSNHNKKNIDWDSIDLLTEIQSRTFTDIADQLGCSVVSVSMRRDKLIGKCRIRPVGAGANP